MLNRRKSTINTSDGSLFHLFAFVVAYSNIFVAAMSFDLFLCEEEVLSATTSELLPIQSFWVSQHVEGKTNRQIQATYTNCMRLSLCSVMFCFLLLYNFNHEVFTSEAVRFLDFVGFL